MPITELGHTGFWVEDLDTMREFRTGMLGLTVTDEDPDLGIVLLSARPSRSTTSSSCSAGAPRRPAAG